MSETQRLTLAGFVGLFLHGVIIAMPGAFLPQWNTTFGSTVNLGLYYSLFLLSGLLGLYVASSRSQRHPWLAVSFVAIAIALAIMVRSPNFGGVALAALPLGFGDGVLNFQCNSLVGELHPKRRIILLNWANATFGWGALCIPLLSSLLSWPIIAILTIALASAAVGLAWNAPPVVDFVPQGSRIAWGQAWPFLGVALVYVGLESAIGTWSGTYLRALGWSSGWSSILLSLFWAGLTLGRLGLGVWISRRPVMHLQHLLLAGWITVLLALLPSLGFGFALAAFFYGPTFATVFALMQERCSYAALGYLFYAAYIGGSATPALLSLLPDPTHRAYGFVVLAIALYFLSRQLPTAPSEASPRS